jgi:uncharacterized protein (TIGR03067 family)
MKIRLAMAVLLGVALATASVTAGGDAKAEMKKFEGTWAVESIREWGEDVPAEKAKNQTFTFRGDKVTSRQDGKQKDEATYQLDPGKKPRHIDFKAEGKTFPGIYAFEGGKLKVCFAQSGAERPTKFESPAGSKIILIVLKRAKK